MGASIWIEARHVWWARISVQFWMPLHFILPIWLWLWILNVFLSAIEIRTSPKGKWQRIKRSHDVRTARENMAG